MIVGALQSRTTWAEDRAMLRSNPSADPGAKIEGRAVFFPKEAAHLPLRTWHQSDKPTRPEAVTHQQEAPLPLANAKRLRFQFTVNQDSTTTRCLRFWSNAINSIQEILPLVRLVAHN